MEPPALTGPGTYKAARLRFSPVLSLLWDCPAELQLVFFVPSFNSNMQIGSLPYLPRGRVLTSTYSVPTSIGEIRSIFGTSNTRPRLLYQLLYEVSVGISERFLGSQLTYYPYIYSMLTGLDMFMRGDLLKTKQQQRRVLTV